MSKKNYANLESVITIGRVVEDYNLPIRGGMTCYPDNKIVRVRVLEIPDKTVVTDQGIEAMQFAMVCDHEFDVGADHFSLGDIIIVCSEKFLKKEKNSNLRKAMAARAYIMIYAASFGAPLGNYTALVADYLRRDCGLDSKVILKSLKTINKWEFKATKVFLKAYDKNTIDIEEVRREAAENFGRQLGKGGKDLKRAAANIRNEFSETLKSWGTQLGMGAKEIGSMVRNFAEAVADELNEEDIKDEDIDLGNLKAEEVPAT